MKKEKEIRYYYDKNKVETDTIIKEYDSTGMPRFGGDMLKKHYKSFKTYTLVDRVLADSSLNKVHYKYHYSDSLVVDEETFYYSDSLVLKVSTWSPNSSSDTLTYVFITTLNLPKNMIHFYCHGFDNKGYQRFIVKRNMFFYSALITNISAKSGYIDSLKHLDNRILRISKDKSINPDTKKWYTSEKRKHDSKSRLKKYVLTYYVKNDKKYYKRKTKYIYSKNDLLVSEVSYDCFDRKVECKTHYEYY